jgi:hypothetical protein
MTSFSTLLTAHTWLVDVAGLLPGDVEEIVPHTYGNNPFEVTVRLPAGGLLRLFLRHKKYGSNKVEIKIEPALSRVVRVDDPAPILKMDFPTRPEPLSTADSLQQHRKWEKLVAYATELHQQEQEYWATHLSPQQVRHQLGELLGKPWPEDRTAWEPVPGRRIIVGETGQPELILRQLSVAEVAFHLQPAWAWNECVGPETRIPSPRSLVELWDGDQRRSFGQGMLEGSTFLWVISHNQEQVPFPTYRYWRYAPTT